MRKVTDARGMAVIFDLTVNDVLVLDSGVCLIDKSKSVALANKAEQRISLYLLMNDPHGGYIVDVRKQQIAQFDARLVAPKYDVLGGEVLPIKGRFRSQGMIGTKTGKDALPP